MKAESVAVDAKVGAVAGAEGVVTGAQAARSSTRLIEKERSFCMGHPFVESYPKDTRRMFRSCSGEVIGV